MTMPETGILRVHVTDHALIRYLERAHGVDIAFFRDHIAQLCGNGVRYGASAVAIDGVKFVLVGASVVSTVKAEHVVYPGKPTP